MYNYQTERASIFTEEGQVMFLKIRDTVQRHLEEAGAVSMEAAIRDCTGSSWEMMACVDRLVELGEIREVTEPGKFVSQSRVFVSTARY